MWKITSVILAIKRYTPHKIYNDTYRRDSLSPESHSYVYYGNPPTNNHGYMYNGVPIGTTYVSNISVLSPNENLPGNRQDTFSNYGDNNNH